MTASGTNRGVPRCNKWSGVGNAADDVPAFSVPLTVEELGLDDEDWAPLDDEEVMFALELEIEPTVFAVPIG
jgi:hypothetical protein